jgi:hypothetical protein
MSDGEAEFSVANPEAKDCAYKGVGTIQSCRRHTYIRRTSFALPDQEPNPWQKSLSLRLWIPTSICSLEFVDHLDLRMTCYEQTSHFDRR